ncbi:MAG: pitrilysin family protein [FCB group bacterium]|jgi:predicted Zn-dependent peptidase|nr:pitrilysin family protein [FCB group bacterium]
MNKSTFNTRVAGGLLFVALGVALGICAHAQDVTNLHRFTLDNGLRVWHLERTESGSVAAQLSVNVGCRNDPEEKSGITHFVEHMTFAGSERYDRTSLMEMLDRRGGTQNAFTKDEQTVFCGEIASKNFDLLMDWLSQVAFHPTFPEDRVDGERSVIVAEKGGKKGWLRAGMEALGQDANLGRELREGLFPKSSLLHDGLGSDRSLEAITHADLVAYYRMHYMPNNATLVVSGNITPERVREVCNEYFGTLKPGTLPQACASPTFPDKAPGTRTLRAVTFEKQSTVLMGVRTCSEKDPDRWPLYVLSELLDRSLMAEGRYKRALAYGIGSGNDFFSDSGCFYISTSCKQRHLKELKEVIEEQINLIRDGKVDAAALADAKESLNGRWTLSMQTNWRYIGWLAWLARVYSNTERIPDRQALIDAITAEELTRVVKTYFVPERTCVAQHIPLL